MNVDELVTEGKLVSYIIPQRLHTVTPFEIFRTTERPSSCKPFGQ